jgi:hypothetical protein
MGAIKNMALTVRELFGFLWRRKLWWLMPMLIMLIFFVILIVLGGTAGIGPFIYTLF